MLVFVGGYSAATSKGMPVMHSVRNFGLVIFLAMLALVFFRMHGAKTFSFIGRVKKQFKDLRE